MDLFLVLWYPKNDLWREFLVELTTWYTSIRRWNYQELTWLLKGICTPFSRSLSHDLPWFFLKKDCIPDLPHSSQVPGERRRWEVIFSPSHPKKGHVRRTCLVFLHFLSIHLLFKMGSYGKFSYLFSGALYFFSFRANVCWSDFYGPYIFQPPRRGRGARTARQCGQQQRLLKMNSTRQEWRPWWSLLSLVNIGLWNPFLTWPIFMAYKWGLLIT